MRPTRLWFVRHGEVQDGIAGAFVGRTEVDLSPLGRHQAEAVKEYLREAEVDAILSSPRRRARDTVSPLAAARGIPLRTVAGFAEMDYGAWEGLHWEQILRRDRAAAERWKEDPVANPIPDGEAVAAFEARIAQALEALVAEFQGRAVVLGTHSTVCRAIIGRIVGLPLMDTFAFVQDYGALNAAAWMPDGSAQVALVNFVPGPRSAATGD